MIWLAFTFSEELGFEEGGHGGDLLPMKLKSDNIWAVGAPSYPFYGEITSIGEVYIISNSGFFIYCSNYVFLLRFS